MIGHDDISIKLDFRLYFRNPRNSPPDFISDLRIIHLNPLGSQFSPHKPAEIRTKRIFPYGDVIFPRSAIIMASLAAMHIMIEIFLIRSNISHKLYSELLFILSFIYLELYFPELSALAFKPKEAAYYLPIFGLWPPTTPKSCNAEGESNPPQSHPQGGERSLQGRRRQAKKERGRARERGLQ